ncbi:MAG TPA: hypothetical protein VKU00_26035 [Chthonomonadaceae bacterium]|nr:hypothetical protein [Chthonomonadaceae bacterium]
MRVPEPIRDCACFLCTQRRDNGNPIYEYRGTAFFVSMPSDEMAGVEHLYLITAKHNIEKAKEKGDLFVRLNKTSGGVEFIKVASEWVYPDNDASDVAILAADFGEEYDFSYLPSEMFVTEDIIAETGIGIGDELVITGLFTERYGEQKNLPIVRFGNISAMPSEPLRDKDSGLMYDAYLAEMRSIGGLSGSPVFVILHPGRHVPAGYVVVETTYYLLGLIRGHWDYTTRESVLDYTEDESRTVNMGIATVSPIQDVLTILDSKELKKERRAADNRLRDKHSPTLD